GVEAIGELLAEIGLAGRGRADQREDRRRAHDAGRRRALCFEEIERRVTLPRPLARNGAFARAIAVSIIATTSGRASVAVDSSRTKRFSFPEPCRMPWGSGSEEPCRNAMPTPFAAAAIENGLSSGFPLGEYPITKKL